ncbi:MAG: zinc ribbon domain-containing protein [Chloroflexota bacterium]
MNCPNCGAINEADARFCTECGTPLEDQSQPVMPPPAEDEADRTILSKGPLVIEDAKTVSVTQADVAAAEVKIEVEKPSSPESKSPPPAKSDSGQGLTSSRNLIIIAIVGLVLLCCCCSILALVGAAGSGVIEDITNELGMGPSRLFFV